MNYIKINYTYKHEKDCDGIITPYFKYKRIVSDSSKRYHNCLHKTSKLSPSARNLLDYIVEKMNNNSEVQNSQLFKMEFIEFMRKNCGITYEDNTVNKKFQELKAAGLIISFEHKKAVYTVNPIHFFRGTEAKRKSLLQKMLNETPNSKYNYSNLNTAMEL